MGDRSTPGSYGSHVDRSGPDLEVPDRSLPADSRRQSLHQGNVGRRTAHVEGQEVRVAGLFRHPGRAGHSTGRPRQQQVDRAVGCDGRGDETTVAAKDAQPSVHTRLAQLSFQVRDIAGDLRLHCCVRHCGDGALVLAQLGQHRGRQRHRYVRQLLGGQLANSVLVVGVRVGVDQADAQGLDPAPLKRPQLRPNVVLVELGDHVALSTDPAAHLDGVLERGERLGLGPDDPAGQAAGDERPRDLQDLSEAVGGDQSDPRALAFEDRVRGDRRTVEHLADLGHRDAGRGTRALDAPQYSDRLVLGGGRGLGPVRLPGVLVDQQNVGERPPDVHAEPVGHGCPSSDDTG
ncbi:hypothetical protein EV648_102501 [Kribbella sp. VKM Ac-2568]|nr:hypothetical protein EV648_102501 [Kribbella sp. VKM Ac-2568]